MHVSELRIIYYITLSILIILAVYCFTQVYPFHVIDVNKVQVVSEKAIAGDPFFYSLDYCKYLEGPVSVGRVLVDENKKSEWNIAEKEPDNNIPMGCHILNVYANIPRDIPAGMYHLKVTGIFHITFLFNRDIPVTFETPSFELVKPYMNAISPASI